ncbi:MAG: MBL fold metallo-hydrolase [Anaerolineae bacterium]|nr:MBL fold metallo-hydrolase [Anaerolineae bacterium]
MNTIERYRFKLGEFECLAVRDYTEVYPLAELTTDAPEEQVAHALRERGFPFEGAVLDFNNLLIHTGETRVLMDTGWGYGLFGKHGRLLEHFQAEGIGPADIGWIVFTHGDIDHTGGILDAEGNPTFPNARYVMWQTAWEFWQAADWSDDPEEIVVWGQQMMQLFRERGVAAEAETEFMPGFQFIQATGHRPHHTVVVVSSAGERLLHLGDAIIHPILIDRADWAWPGHSAPECAREDKRRLLAWAVDHNALVFASHFPFPALGRVTRRREGWQWQAVGN